MDLIEAVVKVRSSSKWQTRFCIIQRPTPASDNIYLYVFKNARSSRKIGQAKQILKLEGFCGLEAGFPYEREQNTLAILCVTCVPVLAFQSNDDLHHWETKLRQCLGQGQQFRVQIDQAPSSSGLSQHETVKLHIQDGRFCLAACFPPVLKVHCSLDHVKRFGPLHNRFCFELSAKGTCNHGMYVLISSQRDQICFAFDLARRHRLHEALMQTPRVSLPSRTAPVSPYSLTQSTLSVSEYTQSGGSDLKPLLSSAHDNNAIAACSHEDAAALSSESYSNEVFFDASDECAPLPADRKPPLSTQAHRRACCSDTNQEPMQFADAYRRGACPSHLPPLTHDVDQRMFESSSCVERCTCAGRGLCWHSCLCREEPPTVPLARVDMPHVSCPLVGDIGVYANIDHGLCNSVSETVQCASIPSAQDALACVHVPVPQARERPLGSSLCRHCHCFCQRRDYINQQFIDSLQFYHNVDHVVLAVSQRCARCCRCQRAGVGSWSYTPMAPLYVCMDAAQRLLDGYAQCVYLDALRDEQLPEEAPLLPQLPCESPPPPDPASGDDDNGSIHVEVEEVIATAPAVPCRPFGDARGSSYNTLLASHLKPFAPCVVPERTRKLSPRKLSLPVGPTTSLRQALAAQARERAYTEVPPQTPGCLGSATSRSSSCVQSHACDPATSVFALPRGAAASSGMSAVDWPVNRSGNGARTLLKAGSTKARRFLTSMFRLKSSSATSHRAVMQQDGAEDPALIATSSSVVVPLSDDSRRYSPSPRLLDERAHAAAAVASTAAHRTQPMTNQISHCNATCDVSNATSNHWDSFPRSVLRSIGFRPLIPSPVLGRRDLRCAVPETTRTESTIPAFSPDWSPTQEGVDRTRQLHTECSRRQRMSLLDEVSLSHRAPLWHDECSLQRCALPTPRRSLGVDASGHGTWHVPVAELELASKAAQAAQRPDLGARKLSVDTKRRLLAALNQPVSGTFGVYDGDTAARASALVMHDTSTCAPRRRDPDQEIDVSGDVMRALQRESLSRAEDSDGSPSQLTPSPRTEYGQHSCGNSPASAPRSPPDKGRIFRFPDVAPVAEVNYLELDGREPLSPAVLGGKQTVNYCFIDQMATRAARQAAMARWDEVASRSCSLQSLRVPTTPTGAATGTHVGRKVRRNKSGASKKFPSIIRRSSLSSNSLTNF